MGTCISMFPFSENAKYAIKESWNQYLLLPNHGTPE